MTDLIDLVPSLKREVAVPGAFTTTFPQTTDNDLAATLGDGFAEAQLAGFFGTQVVDPDAGTVTPDLSPAGRALVVIYAAERMMANRILAMRTRTLYEAAGAKYEVENAATVLKALLDGLQKRKETILANLYGLQRARTSVLMSDQYSDRITYLPGMVAGATPGDPLLPGMLPGFFYTYELLGG